MPLVLLVGVLAISSGGAALYAVQSPPAAVPAQGVWSEKARMFDLRSEVATAFLNGKIYVMGGLARNQEASTLNQEYDIATDTWRDRRPMPFPLSHPNATVLNGKIYVVGGFLAQVHVAAQDSNFEYDPAADTWRILAPLRTPRGSLGVVALNGKIHAIGGRTVDRVTSAVHEIYDPATNTWTPAANMVVDRAFGASPTLLLDGRVLVAGGVPANDLAGGLAAAELYTP
jgi:N-acetylneuraminic acid mutarotase